MTDATKRDKPTPTLLDPGREKWTVERIATHYAEMEREMFDEQ